MAELVVTEFVTLDGVMEAPGGEPTHPHSGWALEYYSDEYGEFKMEELIEAGSHLLGRVTYEGFAGAWPQRSGPFAEKINSMPKYVVTSSLEELEWENCTPISGDIPTEVAKLKESEEKPILVVGSGKRVFPESADKLALELVDSKALPKGVLANTYRRGE